MKRILLFVAIFALLAFPKANFAQAPNLGSASGFALFTASGAFDNDGASVITGNIGSFTYSPVGFPIPGKVVGTIYNVGDPVLTSAADDVATAFGSFSAAGAVLGTPLETYNTTGFIYPGTYHTVGATDMNGNFTLDARGDPNAVFVININGALTVGGGFNILLINSASLCNVYWLIDGGFTLGAGSVFRGTVIASGAITLLEGSSLLGRGLSTAGAISLHNNVVNLASLPAAAGTISGTATICSGQKGLVYSVPAIGNATDYIWTLPAGATIVAGNNTKSITVDFSEAAANGNITVRGTNACSNGAVSANFVLTVNPTVTADAGANRAICINSGSTTIGAASVQGSTYSWSSIPAGFTSTVSNPSVSPNVTTTYTVVETNSSMTCSSNSSSVVVTVNALPAALAGANRATCLNSATLIGAEAVLGSTYSWTSNPSGFTSTLSNPSVTPLVATTYTVVETVTASGCTNSNSVELTLIPSPTAIAGTARAICLNESTILGETAKAGSTYSWSSVPAGFVSTSANPTVTPLVTTTYTVEETITATGCKGKNTVEVSVNPKPAALAGADRAICEKESTRIGGVAVTGSTYSWSSVPAGFTSNEAKPTVTPLVTTTYTVIETNMASGCLNSNSVTVTLNGIPKITTEPADQITCIGSSVSFSVAATGTGLSYQWRKGTLALTNGGNISGATSATLTIFPAKTSDVAADYNVVISGTCSSNEISNMVSLAVNAAPTISTSACVGGSVSFSASALGSGLTYQWRKGDVVLTDEGNISGSNSPTLTINPVAINDAAYNYNVLIFGACSPEATSLSIGLVVNAALSITGEPASQEACTGTSAHFTVVATGTALSYQWRKGNVKLVNGENISGATSATLNILSVSAADVSSDYNVLVTGPCAAMTSSKKASLSLCNPLANASLDSKVTNNAVTIYPNPFTSSIDIKVNEGNEINSYNLKIYNNLGDVLFNTPLTKDITTLQTGNLSSGVYLYEVSSNQKTIQSGKLISK